MNTLYLAHGATKQTLTDWGFTNPRFYPRSRGIGVFTVDIAGGDPAADPGSVIPFGDQVTVSGIFAGMNSGAEAVIFKGARRQWSGRAHPEARSTNLVFCDAVWDLQHTPFQHYWQYQKPGDTSPTTQYFSRINLFQNISAGPTVPWTYFTARQQLQEILTYAQTNCGIAIQAGTIDPAQVFNLMPCKNVSCWDAIMKCLQLLPDVMTQMDYTQTPSKLNFFQRTGSAGVVTLPYSGTDANGRAHKSSDLKDRPDLVPSEVVIQYQQTNTTNGKNTVFWSSDVYPAGAAGNAVQALVAPIDITGPAITTIAKTVNAETFDPTSLDFWKKYKHELALPDIVPDATTPILDTVINGGGGHPDGITVTDESGGAISPAAFPNILLPGDSVSSWMYNGTTPIQAVKVVVTGHLKYTKTKALGSSSVTTDRRDNHEVTVRLTLTNSPAGAVTYASVTSLVQGETAPTGLAQYWYNALRPTPWEGRHVIVEDSIYEIITPANVLNLTGSALSNQAAGATFNPAWATMRAAMVDVEIDFFRGTTTISFGPHRHVSLNEYYDLTMAWRWRAVFQSLDARSTGVYGSGAPVDISGLTTRENTTHSVAETSLATTLGPVAGTSATIIQNDAATNGGQIVINTQKDSSGTPVIDTTQPQVQLSQNDLGASGGVGNIAKWRTWTLPDSTTVKVAASADKTISGGSGGLTVYYLKSYTGYWLCSANNDGSGAHYRVAKPPHLTLGSETILGQSFTYSYGLATTNTYPASFTRSSTRASDSFVEYQALYPMPAAHWPLAANPASTGLTVESADVSDNPGDGVTTSTPIAYADPDSWGTEWYAPVDQNPSDW